MKYKFINKEKILKVSPLMEKMQELYVYANNKENTFKELVIEEKPTYNEETQELYSWFEDAEVITQKFEVIDKETNQSTL
jgi:hypothetical protein